MTQGESAKERDTQDTFIIETRNFGDRVFVNTAPSNAALVKKAAGIITQKGRRVATPTRARELLGLS